MGSPNGSTMLVRRCHSSMRCGQPESKFRRQHRMCVTVDNRPRNIDTHSSTIAHAAYRITGAATSMVANAVADVARPATDVARTGLPAQRTRFISIQCSQSYQCSSRRVLCVSARAAKVHKHRSVRISAPRMPARPLLPVAPFSSSESCDTRKLSSFRKGSAAGQTKTTLVNYLRSGPSETRHALLWAERGIA